MVTNLTIKKELKSHADPEVAKSSSWFFKTQKGEYGEHDRFIGVRVPQQRMIAKKVSSEIPLAETLKLLRSPIHEHRLTALFILVLQFQRSDHTARKKIYAEYIKHRAWVNNWDLVDSSAPQIVGAYLLDHPRAILYRFARSKNLWEKRIAILATQTFIRHDQFEDTMKIAEILLKDPHDLIHKAVGWMLREVGNRDIKTEEQFLQQHGAGMPRTMLRYAVEKFSEPLRQHYLHQDQPKI